MRRTAAMVRKEWQQHRRFLLGAIALFVGPQLVTAALNYWTPASFSLPLGIATVLLLVPVLAILLGVTSTCRELGDSIAEFWQSRPLSVTRWIIAKYVLGILVLLTIVAVSLVPDIIIDHYFNYRPWTGTFAYSLLVWYWIPLTLIYSVSFLVGCLVRETIPALILSLSLMLLMLFVPLVIPALAALSFVDALIAKTGLLGSQLGGTGRYIGFHTAVVVGSLFCIALAGLSVKRSWQVRVERGTILWALGIIGLLLFSTAAFQVGVDMKCLRRIELPSLSSQNPIRVAKLVAKGNSAVLLLTDANRGDAYGSYYLARLDPSGRPNPLDPAVQIIQKSDSHVRSPQYHSVVCSGEHPDRVYFVRTELSRQKPWPLTGLTLCTASLERRSAPIINQLDLLPYVTERWAQGSYSYSDRILIFYQQKIIVVDISDPDAPVIANVVEAPDMEFNVEIDSATSADSLSLALPRIPGLNPRRRLEAIIPQLRWDRRSGLFALEDELLVAHSARQLTTYRLVEVDQEAARFQMVGCRDAPALEHLFLGRTRQLRLRNGFLFVQRLGFNGALSVYDVRDPTEPRRVSHYAAEGLRTFALLDNDTILAGGDRIHVLTLPIQD